MPEARTYRFLPYTVLELREHSIPSTAEEHFRRSWGAARVAVPQKAHYWIGFRSTASQIDSFTTLVDSLSTTGALTALYTAVQDEMSSSFRVLRETLLSEALVRTQDRASPRIRELKERVTHLEERVARLEQRPEMPVRVLPEEGDPFELLLRLKDDLGEERFLSFAKTD